MKPNTPQNRARVARHFIRVLREWLSPSLMGKVVARNLREREPNCCHSHDFCDANMAMHEAFRKCRLFSPVSGGDSEADQLKRHDASELWNAAWDFAKRAQFHEDRVPKLPRLKKCEDCGKRKTSVVRVDCPYEADVYGRKVRVNLCPPCYNGRIGDI